ncbi:F-box/kelch-repeat protein At3g23880-like isoform X1 [Apium graveolens]|uniref:F-box/kelch-repeat protein At3g23880-like isoform X1 n=1 Tax=Apium graveolens TaxID=4045 RepID=UPI003D7B7122
MLLSSRSRFAYTSVHDAPEHSGMIGSINGLICLTYKRMYMFWNPATGLVKTILPPQPYYGNKKSYIKLSGFGWDHSESEFKVVVCFRAQTLLQGVVYTSNSDSWIGLDIPDTFFIRCIMGSTATIVRGCPYWTATTGYDKFVLKFESASNHFKEFMLPSQITSTHRYNVVNIKDSLATMAYLQLPGAMVDVFHLDEEYGVWSKTYTLGPIHCCLATLSQCFKYGDEVVFNIAKLLYDPKTKGVKVIGDGYWDFVRGYSYTPSLVSLLGMKPLHTESQWTSSPAVERSLVTPAQLSLRLVFGRLLLKCFGCD